MHCQRALHERSINFRQQLSILGTNPERDRSLRETQGRVLDQMFLILWAENGPRCPMPSSVFGQKGISIPAKGPFWVIVIPIRSELVDAVITSRLPSW